MPRDVTPWLTAFKAYSIASQLGRFLQTSNLRPICPSFPLHKSAIQRLDSIQDVVPGREGRQGIVVAVRHGGWTERITRRLQLIHPDQIVLK